MSQNGYVSLFLSFFLIDALTDFPKSYPATPLYTPSLGGHPSQRGCDIVCPGSLRSPAVGFQVTHRIAFVPQLVQHQCIIKQAGEHKPAIHSTLLAREDLYPFCLSFVPFSLSFRYFFPSFCCYLFLEFLVSFYLSARLSCCTPSRASFPPVFHIRKAALPRKNKRAVKKAPKNMFPRSESHCQALCIRVEAADVLFLLAPRPINAYPCRKARRPSSVEPTDCSACKPSASRFLGDRMHSSWLT